LRFRFFPGSEFSPPDLLGGIFDLDCPQHLIANLFLDNKKKEMQLRPVSGLEDTQLRELVDFTKTLAPEEFRRVPVADIMHYTTRHRAMC